MDLEQLLKSVKDYAESQDTLELNPDDRIVISVVKGLLKNEEKYGYRYCPCRPVTGNKEEDAPKICPCKWHKDEIRDMGHCTCNLFVAAKQ
jgi:ferredoxin-thioredoxin reductase catalytic chain